MQICTGLYHPVGTCCDSMFTTPCSKPCSMELCQATTTTEMDQCCRCQLDVPPAFQLVRSQNVSLRPLVAHTGAARPVLYWATVLHIDVSLCFWANVARDKQQTTKCHKSRTTMKVNLLQSMLCVNYGAIERRCVDRHIVNFHSFHRLSR